VAASSILFLVFASFVSTLEAGRLPTIEDVADTALFGRFLDHLTAVIRAVKYIQCPGSEEILDTWQHLSQASKWLHWKEVLAVVKQQREVYEAAATSLCRAREGLRYAVLLLYTCLPPGRSLEYRMLQFRLCSRRELYPTVPTPPDPGLLQNRPIGRSSENSPGGASELLPRASAQVPEEAPSTSAGTGASQSQDTHGRSFADDHNSCRWSQLISSTFQRRSGVNLGPNMIRSVFVTYLLGTESLDGTHGLSRRMLEQFASAMRHSTDHVRQNLKRQADECR
jgi:hypothetical protein